MEKSENLKYWNQMKTVPKERLKIIQAGRMKGKSDINPQWRYEKLTEIFGVCGFGWKFSIEKQWLETYSDGQIAAFANINLFVKIEDNWSDPIPGNGGSMFVANESRGPFVSDECFKMAITDALGTAAKMIGLASDVYQGLADSKYSDKSPNPNSNTAPEKPWLNKGEKLDKAMEYLRGGGTINIIESKYRISKEIRESLMKAIES